MDVRLGKLGHGWPIFAAYVHINCVLKEIRDARVNLGESERGQRQPLFGCRRQRNKP